MKILFATPAGGGHVHWQYHLATHSELFLHPDRLAQQSRYEIAQFLAGGYSGLSKDRGIVASYALREGYDKLLFVDADQSWKWEDVKKLLDSDKPIVGGMVAMKFYPVQLNFAHMMEDRKYYEPEDNVTTPLGIARWRAHNLGQDEMRVSAVGTGFLCIDVKTLAGMVEGKHVESFLYSEMGADGNRRNVKCWDFFPSGPLEGVYYGEDYGFCISAGRAGFHPWVNTSVEIPHHGQHTYEVKHGRAGRWAVTPPPILHPISGQMPLPFPENG